MPESAWQKSSYSGASDNCVELRAMNEMVELRESDEAHLTIHTTPTALATLLHDIKAGEFDHHA
ncbi:DUF397 domain-containing protein [Streptomyces sp. CBMA156]|uniref:DUF397 domain-containing protein n=1 Tax=Streptomyces sp. CBMA156 TaxID=1930280 RepID=UPI0016619DFD|nr:DUF397 domain-containing protein [Streptomyces sp. CBMA156]MBD0675063.1 DUF397 domain-containing protein [Streptomyces sp. CBMA156]